MRPGVQVPLATACTFASLAAIALRLLRIGALWRPAGDLGVAVAALLSLGALRLLARTDDADKARVRAIAWPPALAGLVGVVVDLALHARFPRAELAFEELPLSDLGAGEPVAVGMLSACVGLFGSLVLAPQVWLLARTRERGDAADVTRMARSLAVAAWALALVAGAVSLLAAREGRAPVAVFCLASAGLLAQLVVLRGERTVAMPATGPYR
jgi:hypothetical protein